MNFFDHKDLGNHLLQLCPKVVKHPVYPFSISSFQENTLKEHLSVLFFLIYSYKVIIPHSTDSY